MVTPNDMADAIEELVANAFPREPVYRGYVPANFQRPSTLLEQGDWTARPNFSCGAVSLYPRFTLTAFVPTDAYHQGDSAELSRRQMRLLGLFLPGYIKTGDRRPHVEDGVELANGLDFAAVTVTLSVALSRDEFMKICQQPIMGALHLNEEVTTNG